MYQDTFTDSQIETLNRFVTTTEGNIFALKNLPEVIKGALFSRYSRTSMGLRALLLKEFISNEDMEFAAIAEEQSETANQQLAVQKAQSFYDRILDGYGDDSIGELGGAHLAVENVSMLGAKAIQDCRIGGSPLEKSTRYIYFDHKIDGKYAFYEEPVLMTSAYRDLYLNTCTHLFETYSKLIPPLTTLIERDFPKDPNISKGAYTAALRAKVLDCLRGLLPTSTLTSMGVFGNGRFFESLLQKLNCNSLAEMQDIGKKSYTELSKVIPSFVRRAEMSHKHQKTFTDFTESMQGQIKQAAQKHKPCIPNQTVAGVRLLDFDPASPRKVASALLFPHTRNDFQSLDAYCNHLSDEDINVILETASSSRENRRHKSPRALERASFTFEIVADYGIYRDLHRHRTLTQERQLFNCDYDYYIPPEIIGTEMETEYRNALEEAKKAYDLIATELPEEAQYVIPMAFNVRWYFHINLRALQWLCELRSQAAGHTMYRLIAQKLAHQTSVAVPAFERFFKFVDYEGYELGRLDAEIRQEQKALAREKMNVQT